MPPFEQYHTQMLLPGFGIAGQQKLAAAKVLIIGAGGLGCPCAQYLAAAGVGLIGVCDADTIEIENLHRQILFTRGDIGRKKTEVMKQRLEAMNPDIRIVVHDFFLEAAQTIALFSAYDMLVDCTDDLHTRFLINDACKLLKKTLVYGAVFQYEAQLAVFYADENKTGLRDLFSETHQAEIVTCNEAGILGMITGILGCMQALEVVKQLIGSPGKLQNEMLVLRLAPYQQYIVKISTSTQGEQGPETEAAFLRYPYQQRCVRPTKKNRELDRSAFLQKIKDGNVQIVDVRNHDEKPYNTIPGADKIPLPELLQHPALADPAKTVLLFCHAGIRSQKALEFLLEECHYPEVYHLKGGILKWENNE